MTDKIYGPGSTLFNTDLNDFQDDYIDGALTPWTLVGGTSFYVYQATIRYPQCGAPRADAHTGYTRPQGLGCAYLDPADFPSSYNGSLRALQLRVVANVITAGVSIGSMLSTLALRPVPSGGLTLANVESGPSQKYVLGTPLGSISFPTITDTLASLRFEGAAFAFPAAGLYTMELVQIAAPSANAGAFVHAYLQRRAI